MSHHLSCSSLFERQSCLVQKSNGCVDVTWSSFLPKKYTCVSRTALAQAPFSPGLYNGNRLCPTKKQLFEHKSGMFIKTFLMIPRNRLGQKAFFVDFESQWCFTKELLAKTKKIFHMIIRRTPPSYPPSTCHRQNIEKSAVQPCTEIDPPFQKGGNKHF